MKKRIFTSWNFQRAVFTITGGFILIQSIIEKQWVGIAFGLYFTAMGLFAIGCAAGNCFTGNKNYNPEKKSPSTIEDVEFEEIKIR